MMADRKPNRKAYPGRVATGSDLIPTGADTMMA